MPVSVNLMHFIIWNQRQNNKFTKKKGTVWLEGDDFHRDHLKNRNYIKAHYHTSFKKKRHLYVKKQTTKTNKKTPLTLRAEAVFDYFLILLILPQRLLLIKIEGFLLILLVKFLQVLKAIPHNIRRANVSIRSFCFRSILEHNSKHIIMFSTPYSRKEKLYDKNRNNSASIC